MKNLNTISNYYFYTAFLFSAILFLSGCIILPTNYHRFGSRENISKETCKFIVPGITTKDDIFLLLGEPDKISVDQSSLEYDWTKVVSIFLVTLGYYGGGGEVEKGYKLVINFDDQNIVTTYHYQ